MYFLLIISGAIFSSEFIIMMFFHYLPHLPAYQEAFLDAFILTAIVFPVLYLLVFRPLTIYIRIGKETEKEKNSLIDKLQKALDEVKTLQGIIPICSSCKKIRDDEGYWNRIESYMEKRTDAHFSHSICPECEKKLYSDEDWFRKKDFK